MRYFYFLMFPAILFLFCLTATAQVSDLADYSDLSQAELKAKAGAGDSHAMFSYGYSLIFGEGDSDGLTLIDNPDFETAIPLIQAAHEAGHPSAHTILINYYAGIFGQPENEQALENIILDAEQRISNNTSRYYYAVFFIDSDDSVKSAKAFKYFNELKTDPNFSGESFENIVQTLYQGSSAIKADYPRGREEAMKCVESHSDNSFCAYILGRDYQQGWGGSANPEMSAKYFLIAAENGDARAQWQTGMNYLEGFGDLGVDEKKAYKWVKAAAEQDYLQGLISFGVMNAIGQGTEINYDASFTAYEKAARMGSPHALRSIGGMHYSGEGRPVNKELALAALLLAFDKGDEMAGDGLSRFYDITTQEDRDEARFLVSGEIEEIKSTYDWEE